MYHVIDIDPRCELAYNSEYIIKSWSFMSKRWREILINVGVPIVVLGCFVYWLGWSGSTNDIESAANQFKPDSSWKLVGNDANPPKTLCFDGTCPGLRKAWELPAPIQDRTAFEKIAQINDTRMNIDNNCFYKAPSDKVASKLCGASLLKNGYHIELDYSGYDSPATLILYIDQRQ
jgi:hypothetical protein